MLSGRQVLGGCSSITRGLPKSGDRKAPYETATATSAGTASHSGAGSLATAEAVVDDAQGAEAGEHET